MALGRPARGFTLTELAVVLAIVGLLLGSVMYTLSAQVEQRNFNETRNRLAEAKELLLAYAIVNGRLPCPATLASAGVEAPEGGAVACDTNYAGYLPAVTIGFQPSTNGFGIDAWGNKIRYAVSQTTLPVGTPPHFTNATNLKANGIATKANDISICAAWGGSTTDCGTAQQVTNASSGNRVVAAVIWSQGKNFATVGSGGADEAANNKIQSPPANLNPVFVSHPPTPSGAGEFDDLLIWITTGELYGRLISAGVLP